MKPADAGGIIQDEQAFPAFSGYVSVIAPVGLLLAAVITVLLHRSGAAEESGGHTVGLAVIAGLVALCAYGFLGLKVVNPGRAAVVTLLGSYRGTVQRNGFIWVFPICRVEIVDVRVVNLITDRLKVNDAAGNPVEIAAIVVYRVARPARSVFNIGTEVETFVKIQAESALRALTSEHAYEPTEGGPVRDSLRDNAEGLAARLVSAVQAAADIAGVVIGEARISHLAYAPEVAPAMLRRQQAEALLIARRKIAEGAVSVAIAAVVETERGLKASPGGISDADRFRLAGNLLVALCSQGTVQPTLPLES